MKRISYGAALVALAAALAAPGALAQAGTLDPSFGTGGRVTIDLGGPDPLNARDGARAVALQPDGKVVLGGYQRGGAVVVRLSPDGALDPGFGDGGRAPVLTGDTDEVAFDVFVDPDGKVLACGSRLQTEQFGLVRLLPDGAPDPGFGTAGTVLTGAAVGFSLACARQPDGKYLMTGNNGGQSSTPERGLALVRFLSDGSLDATFGGDGVVVAAPDNPVIGTDVLVQPDGRIVVAGANFFGGPGSDLDVFRFLANGDPDPSFGGDGVVSVQDGVLPFGLALDSAGRILVVGTKEASPSDDDVVVARLLPDGGLDGTFGAGGVTVTDVTPGDDTASRALVQPDGKVLVTVYTNGPAPTDFVLLRYDAAGVLDPSFGEGGRVTTDFGGADASYDLALQPDGRIVVAGRTRGADMRIEDVAVARYLNDAGGVPAEPASTVPGSLSVALAPNPVGPAGARVRYDVPVGGRVRLTVTDVLGREVAVLVDAERVSGPHSVTLGPGRLAPGVYLVRLTVGDETRTRRITVLR